MKKAEYMALVERELDRIKSIIAAKNNDYTAASDSAFANFESTPDLASPFSGVLIRMGDKFQRLKTYAAKGRLEVAGEGVEDAARDIIGYALILLGMLADAKPPVRTRNSGVDEDLALVASLRAEQVKVDEALPDIGQYPGFPLCFDKTGPHVSGLQAKTPLKLAVGKYYKTAEGTLVGPIQKTPENDPRRHKYPFSWKCFSYTATGQYALDYPESSLNLIKEVEAPVSNGKVVDGEQDQS